MAKQNIRQAPTVFADAIKTMIATDAMKMFNFILLLVPKFEFWNFHTKTLFIIYLNWAEQWTATGNPFNLLEPLFQTKWNRIGNFHAFLSTTMQYAGNCLLDFIDLFELEIRSLSPKGQFCLRLWIDYYGKFARSTFIAYSIHFGGFSAMNARLFP